MVTRWVRRFMVFADGENLVCRYQAMVRDGRIPRTDVDHISDVVIWNKRYTSFISPDPILRATYYTYVVGDELRVRSVEETIRKSALAVYDGGPIPTSLTPRVFKKQRKNARGKGVDIAMVVDVLTHVHADNVDSVLLLSGDGDYIPLIREVQRSGKQCYVAAFSSGLHPEIPLIADDFHPLDGLTFQSSTTP